MAKSEKKDIPVVTSQEQRALETFYQAKPGFSAEEAARAKVIAEAESARRKRK
jgi:hypothetical protein